MAGGPAPIPYDFDAAHAAGLDDAHIVQALSKSGKVPNYDFEGALSSGVTPGQIVQMLGGKPQQSGIVDSALEGVSAPFSGFAKTLETHVGKNVISDTLDKGAKAVAPPTYSAAPLYDKEGFHAGNIPSWLAANVPSMGVALTAAKATPGPWWAKALGGAAAGFLMNAGNEDQQAADTRTGTPNATPTWGDVARGDLTSAAANTVGALPLARYLPGATALDKVGAKGVAQALGRYGTTVAEQGASNYAANAVEQVGQSVGTDKGTQIDPYAAANAGAGGALTGAYFGARPALRNTLDAKAFSEVTNDPLLREAATQVANQLQKNSDGEQLDGGLILSRQAQKNGAVALKKTQIGVRNNLDAAINDVKRQVTLPSDAENVLTGIKEGTLPSPEDYDTLQQALDNSNYQQAPQLMNAVRQAHALQALSDVGHVVEGKFKGGIEGVASHILTGENVSKSAIVGLAAGLGENAGHIIAYSPHVIGGFAGLTALARLMDNVTGAHTPAGRIVRNFANPNVPATFTPTPGAAPHVPNTPLPGQPWGPAPAALMPWQRARLVQATMPLLRQLATQQQAQQTQAQTVPANVRAATRNLVHATQPQGPVVQVPRPGFVPPIGWVPPGANQPQVTPPMQPRFAPPTTAAPMNADAIAALAARARAQNVTKVNGATQVNNEEFPKSSYAGLDPRSAAEAVYRVNQSTVNHPEGYKNSTANRITKERFVMAQIGREVPGLPIADLTARLEYVQDQTRAKAFREWVKKSYPYAAGALDDYLSDATIADLWNRKGK